MQIFVNNLLTTTRTEEVFQDFLEVLKLYKRNPPEKFLLYHMRSDVCTEICTHIISMAKGSFYIL